MKIYNYFRSVANCGLGDTDLNDFNLKASEIKCRNPKICVKIPKFM